MSDHKNVRLSTAPRNRTLRLNGGEVKRLRQMLLRNAKVKHDTETANTLICGDAFQLLSSLPKHSFDLLFADPPYNLTKNFGTAKFSRCSLDEYEAWLDSWLRLCVSLLKETASIYICGDWRSSAAIQRIGSRYFTLRNR